MRARPIDDILWDAILEKAVKPLGRKRCSAELRNTIIAACASYRFTAASSAQKRRAYLQKRSAAMATTARDLSRLLQEIFFSDDPNSAQAELSFILFTMKREFTGDDKVSELIADLDALSQIAAQIHSSYQSHKGGCDADIDLHVMLAKLKAIFESVTGD